MDVCSFLSISISFTKKRGRGYLAAVEKSGLGVVGSGLWLFELECPLGSRAKGVCDLDIVSWPFQFLRSMAASASDMSMRLR